MAEPTGPGQSAIIDGMFYRSAPMGNSWYWENAEGNHVHAVRRTSTSGEDAAYYPLEDTPTARGDALVNALAAVGHGDTLDLGDAVRYELPDEFGFVLQDRNNVTIRGGLITRRNGTDTYRTMLHILRCRNCRIEGMILDGEAGISAPTDNPPTHQIQRPNENGSNKAELILVEESPGTRVISSELRDHAAPQNTPGAGTLPQYPDAMGVYFDLDSHGSSVESTTFTKMGYAGVAAYAENVDVSDCLFDDSQWHGVVVRANNAVIDSSIFRRDREEYPNGTTIGYQGGINVSVSDIVTYPIHEVRVTNCQFDFQYDVVKDPANTALGGMFMIKTDGGDLFVDNCNIRHGKNNPSQNSTTRDSFRIEGKNARTVSITNTYASGGIGRVNQGTPEDPEYGCKNLVIQNSKLGMDADPFILIYLACENLVFENNHCRYQAAAIKGTEDAVDRLVSMYAKSNTFEPSDSGRGSFCVKGDYMLANPQAIYWDPNNRILLNNQEYQHGAEAGAGINFTHQLSDTDFGRLCLATNREPNNKQFDPTLTGSLDHGLQEAISDPVRHLEPFSFVPFSMPVTGAIDVTKSNYQKLDMVSDVPLSLSPALQPADEGMNLWIWVKDNGNTLSVPGEWDPAATYSQPLFSPFVLQFELIDDGTGDVRPQYIGATVEGGGGGVLSWNGRQGIVLPQASDYDADEIDFSPGFGISATDVQGAIEETTTNIIQLTVTGTEPLTGGGAIGTNPSITMDLPGLTPLGEQAAVSDLLLLYDASALGYRSVRVDELGVGGGGGVLSWNSRTGTVNPQADDYQADLITVTPTGNISSTEVQAALVELQTDIDTQAADISGLQTKTTQIDNYTVTAGTALSGGGIISASPTIDVDINGTPNIGGLVADDDVLLLYDTSTGQTRSARIDQVVQEGGVTSWNGRTGAVVPAVGDYIAAAVIVVPGNGMVSGEVQAALDEHQTDINDINAYTLTSGEGLAGGGTISTNLTLSVDIPGTPAIVGPVENLDEVLVYDTSAGGHRSVAVGDLLGDAGVTSWNGRTGAVIPESGDYIASAIVVIPSAGMTSSDVQGALDEHQTDINTINGYSIAAGEGLTGGGGISTNPSLDLDIDSLPNAASVSSTDRFVIWNGIQHRKANYSVVNTNLTTGTILPAQGNRSISLNNFDLAFTNVRALDFTVTGLTNFVTNGITVEDTGGGRSSISWKEAGGGGNAILIAGPGAVANDFTVELWDSLPATESLVLMSDAGKLINQDPRDYDLTFQQYEFQYGGDEPYRKGDQVTENGYLGVAKRDTFDHLEPQVISAPYDLVPGDPSTWPVQSISTAQMITGNVFTFTTAREIGPVTVYYPSAGEYQLRLRVITDPARPITTLLPRFFAAEAGSREFEQRRIVSPGDVIEIAIIKHAAGAAPSFSANYDYQTGNNNATPASGQIIHRNNFEFLCHKTDDDSVDRSAQLATLEQGDTIEGAGITWTVESSTDSGAWITLTLIPTTRGSTGVHLFTFTQPAPETLDYYEEIDTWTAPTVGYSAIGFRDDADGARFESNNGYGCQLGAVDLILSDDWHIQSTPGGGGGGGGGEAGVSTFNGRSGAVMPQAGDYAADQVTVTPTGNLVSTEVQAALVELQGDIDNMFRIVGTKAARPDPATLPAGSLVKVTSSDVEYRVEAGAYVIVSAGVSGDSTRQAEIADSGDAEPGQVFFNVETGGTFEWDVDDWSEVANW